MRKSVYNLEDIKLKINSLQGKSVEFVINKGRNKYITLDAFIEKIYPSMFVIKPLGETRIDKTSFSYSDVLCGQISFNEKVINQ